MTSPRIRFPSHRTLETAKPAAKDYPIALGDALTCMVLTNGKKRWIYRFRIDGKASIYTIGYFPSVTIAQAKAELAEARKLVASGINPNLHKRATKEARIAEDKDTFKTLSADFLTARPPRSAATLKKTQWLLDIACAQIGKMPVKSIRPVDAKRAYKEYADAGKLETASRIRHKCAQVCDYAIAHDRMSSNPFRDLRGTIETVETKHRPALVTPAEVGPMLAAMYDYKNRGTLNVSCALRLSALTFVRPGELRAARWEDIDFDAAEWRFTPPKTKRASGVDLLVPLSLQAIETLRELHKLNQKSDFVFNAPGNKEGFMSEAGVTNALARLGYKGSMTAHGFRAMARTMLDEVLRFPPAIVELQLAHAVKDPNGRAYNRTAEGVLDFV